jgi:16S rRNA (adenine1518-N6/adenine1519-N6)-dimethyltransferase
MTQLPFVRPKKHLGQHFLHDKNIAAKIANAIPDDAMPILEIGPGMGMLTQFLLQRKNPLKVIEIDYESVKYLQTNMPNLPNENIIEGDFLAVDMKTICDTPFAVVGNFPYNISSQILFKIVENSTQIPLLCGMFQKEVAERIAANHGNKQYGILTVLLKTWYDVELLFAVGEKAFTPPPKVQSAVVLIREKAEKPDIPDKKLYIRIVKAAFGQRRKMLKNALAAAFGAETDLPFGTMRAEQLTVKDFIRLYNEIVKSRCC